MVRNGHLPKRTITTGVGPIEVQQPRVLDRRPDGEAEPFSSKILPPYLRKTKSLEELIPWLYLKGRQHGRLQRSPGGAGGSELSRPVGLDRHAAQSVLGGRIPGVE